MTEVEKSILRLYGFQFIDRKTKQEKIVISTGAGMLMSSIDMINESVWYIDLVGSIYHRCNLIKLVSEIQLSTTIILWLSLRPATEYNAYLKAMKVEPIKTKLYLKGLGVNHEDFRKLGFLIIENINQI